MASSMTTSSSSSKGRTSHLELSMGLLEALEQGGLLSGSLEEATTYLTEAKFARTGVVRHQSRVVPTKMRATAAACVRTARSRGRSGAPGAAGERELRLGGLIFRDRI